MPKRRADHDETDGERRGEFDQRPADGLRGPLGQGEIGAESHDGEGGEGGEHAGGEKRTHHDGVKLLEYEERTVCPERENRTKTKSSGGPSLMLVHRRANEEG